MKINIAVWWVLDYETGERETLGGLERWTRDLVIELVSKGHDVAVFQKSKVSYKREYYGASITGIPSSRNFSGNVFFYRTLRSLCDHADVCLFISQDLLWGSHFSKAIAVNHGVWWSSRQSKLKRLALEKFNSLYLRRAQKTICVDTNYINWVIESVSDSHLLLDKIAHVPNYFDPELFLNSETRVQNRDGKIRILFPRRIMGNAIASEPRGGEDAINALHRIRLAGIDATLTMLGEGNLSGDLKKLSVRLNLASFIDFQQAQFDEMPSFYDSHDIVFVPSRFSEGTSLSAIEGLAAGCYVIGSCVGGLQNLPLFPPLGDMVVPNANALAEAVIKFVQMRQSQDVSVISFRKDIMSRFSIVYWKKSVLDIINIVASREEDR